MTQPLMTLTARLDVNQVDDGINWLFADLDAGVGNDCAREDPRWNRNIDFKAGQKFRIAIVASDQDHTKFESLEVIDCCLITRPQILCCGKGVRTRYAPPSLFVQQSGEQLGALFRIDPAAFSVVSTGVDPAKGRKVSLLWDGHLSVGDLNGSWELAFYVTLSIKRAHEEARQLRVFYFDPEGEVTNGTDPP